MLSSAKMSRSPGGIHAFRLNIGRQSARLCALRAQEDPAEKFLTPGDILRQIALESGMRFVTVEDEDEDEKETYLEALEEDPWMRDGFNLPTAAPDSDDRFLFGLQLDPDRPSRSAYEDEMATITAEDLAALIYPGKQETEPGMSEAPDTPSALLLDIRSPAEFASKQILEGRARSFNIVLENLTRQLHRDKFEAGTKVPVIIVCDAGVSDQFAKAAFVRLTKVFGVLDVRILAGGLAEWEEKKLPLVSGPVVD